MTNTDPEMARIVAIRLGLFDAVKRAHGWTDDDFRAVLHGDGSEPAPVGILTAKPAPKLCQVACPYCRAVQIMPTLPADCRECGRRFSRTGPIQRVSR